MNSDIPDGWSNRRLGDLADVSWGDTKTTKTSYVAEGYRAFSAAGPDGFLPYYDYQRDGVIVSAIGANCGKVYFATGKWSCIKNTIRFWGRNGIADTRFLYYATSVPGVWPRRGSAQPFIAQSDARHLQLCIPVDLHEQKTIACILGSLDDRISSSRRLAALLEGAAAMLFRARFVDFIGVDEFEPSEIGPLPKGWRVGSVYDLADVTYGRPFRSNLFNSEEGTPLIRIRDLPTNQPSVVTPEVRADARMIRRGDIVVGMDGEFRAYCWSGPDAWLNQRVCVFDPHDHVSRAFVLEAIKRPLAFFEATKGGTTVIHLGKRDIDTFAITVPPPEFMCEFATTADPLIRLAVELRWESHTLADIRDTLLPKLISGEIRVPDTNDPDEVIGPAGEQLAQATR